MFFPSFSEGDRRAYYESSYFTMQRNRDKIAALRKELYDLRRRLRERIYVSLALVCPLRGVLIRQELSIAQVVNELRVTCNFYQKERVQRMLAFMNLI